MNIRLSKTGPFFKKKPCTRAARLLVKWRQNSFLAAPHIYHSARAFLSLCGKNNVARAPRIFLYATASSNFYICSNELPRSSLSGSFWPLCADVGARERERAEQKLGIALQE